MRTCVGVTLGHAQQLITDLAALTRVSLSSSVQQRAPSEALMMPALARGPKVCSSALYRKLCRVLTTCGAGSQAHGQLQNSECRHRLTAERAGTMHAR